MALGGEWVGSYPGSALRWRHVLVILLVVLAVFAAGLAVGMASPRDDGGEVEAPTAGPPESSTTEPSLPAGHPRTRAGATRAARDFLSVGAGSLIADPARYLAVMEEMSAPEWDDRARATGRNAIAFFEHRYGRDGSALSVPVATEIKRFSRVTAVVELWSVAVMSGPKHPDGEQIWGRTSLSLRWVEGDWRVSTSDTRSVAPPLLPEGQQTGSVAAQIEEFASD